MFDGSARLYFNISTNFGLNSKCITWVMLFNNRQTILFIFMFLFFAGCNKSKNELIPEHVQELKNLKVYSEDVDIGKTISFDQEVVYGGSDDIFIGIHGDIAVDLNDLIYISNSFKKIIYVFEHDGQFIGQLGGEGRGPGEFSKWIKNLQIFNHHLYALDASMHRLNVFSLNDLSHIDTIPLAGNRNRYPELARAFLEIRNLYVRSDGTFIAEFVNHFSQERTERYENIDMQSHFYLLDSSGTISSKLIDFISATLTDLGIVFNLNQFFGQRLKGFSSDDQIYIADPNYFLIKTYYPNGHYKAAFYYPIKKIPLTRETAERAGISLLSPFGNKKDDLLEKVELPNTWPVLTDMVIDDQDRLWVATTVDDMNVFEWWVLEESGEVVTRFDWPRSKPIEVVRNGHVYTRETDEETGLQQVVRYRIEFSQGN